MPAGKCPLSEQWGKHWAAYKLLVPLPHYVGAHSGGHPLADLIANPAVKHRHNTSPFPGPSVTWKWALLSLPCEQTHRVYHIVSMVYVQTKVETEAVVWFAFKAKEQLPSGLIFNGINSIVNSDSLSLSTHSKGAQHFLIPLWSTAERLADLPLPG